MKLFEFDEHIGYWRVLVQTRDIQNGAIQSRHIADRAVSGQKIAPNTIPGRCFQDECITGDHIEGNTVIPGKIAPNAVGTRHIVNKAVTPEKVSNDFVQKVVAPYVLPVVRKMLLKHEEDMKKVWKEMAELRQLVTSYTANGIALSNQFGSHDDIGITQRTLTNAINAIWKTIRDMKGEVNDGITVTITPDWFISEDTAQVNISAKANDGVFEKLQIYINDEPVFEEPVENVQMIEHVATMSETSRVKTVAQILGMEHTDEQIVTKYYPFFMGSGQDWEDIVNEQYVRNLNNGKLRGGYNINIEHDGDYMFIIIPTSRQSEIVRFDMNGYEIPMEVINNQVYTIYKSANAYRKGLFQIDITTNCECEDCQ